MVLHWLVLCQVLQFAEGLVVYSDGDAWEPASAA
jgi:hypothetical protein